MRTLTLFDGERHIEWDIAACRPGDIDFKAVAWSLSHMNRYLGATPVPYSVGLHSIYCARLAEWMMLGRDAILACATHDFHEVLTGLGDMTRPGLAALHSSVREEVDAIASRIDAAIAERLGIAYPLYTPAVERVDDLMLRIERLVFCGSPELGEKAAPIAVKFALQCFRLDYTRNSSGQTIWSPENVRRELLAILESYSC